MSFVQLQALLPMLIVTATVVAVMLAIAIKRDHRTSALIMMLGMSLALACLIPGLLDVGGAAIPVTQLMVIDGPARLGMMLILITTLGVLTLCYPYFQGYQGNRDEVYLLIGVGTLGALTLACAQHAATLLLGLELLSLPMVAGVAYAVDQRRSIEGGVKYLVLSAAASATLLFGLALIYAQTGALDIVTLAEAIGSAGAGTPLVSIGALMLLAGLAFKLSLVPFHQWTPDVYEAAPTPITAYLATVVKLGAFIAILRLFHGGATGMSSPFIVTAVVGLALASMLVGSVLALRQTNLKRLLAYSSTANFGYLAVVLAVPGLDALRAGGMYLAAYLVTSLGVFGVMSVVSSPMRGRDVEELREYEGLVWHRPYLATVFVTMLLSLAGVPLTAGFIGKFAVIGAGVQAAQWWLVGGVVLASAIGAYYYLRVIGAVLATAAATPRSPPPAHWAYAAGGVMLALAMLLVVVLGVYPQPLFEFGSHLALP
jgi:NADH-quinone oxidoreductase subunit N